MKRIASRGDSRDVRRSTRWSRQLACVLFAGIWIVSSGSGCATRKPARTHPPCPELSDRAGAQYVAMVNRSAMANYEVLDFVMWVGDMTIYCETLAGVE